MPKWVKFIAQDSDGNWWGYSVEPLQNDTGWYENEVGRYIKLSEGKQNPDWKDSLKQLK